MEKKPLVSIIIPIKKSSQLLKKCLFSIRKQSFRPIEVIVNDNQAEPTAENKKICQSFKSRSLKIKYLVKNQSMGQARHSGFLASKGNFIFHLDADMTLTKNVVRDSIKKIRKFDALIIPEKSVGKGFWTKCRAFERSYYVGDDVIESARFIKREVYKKIGYHDDKLVASEDKDLDLRIRQAGYSIGRIKSFIHHYEGEIKLGNHFKKKFFYGQSAGQYIKKHPLFALMQANVIFRPAFFRHWQKLIKNPLLTIGVFILKAIEFSGVILGLIYKKLSQTQDLGWTPPK